MFSNIKVGTTKREGLWQPTPVFLPRKSHGHRSWEDYSPMWLQKGQPQLSDQTNKVITKDD